ncbi:MAG: M28 family metallopeptidase [Nocardioides sp.]|uniref:M28 family metallopeptidase n=1 Tax=Nocardioides sp. TaxID=35761 RepID=UPI003F022FED
MAALATVVATLAVAVTPAEAERESTRGGHGDSRCDRVNNSTGKLLQCVTLKGSLEHAKALQRIADDNDGNRALGTPGYDASAAYVAAKLKRAGYKVSTHEFTVNDWKIVRPSTLEQTAPTPTTYVEDVDFAPTDQSPAGEVTAAVTPVDVALGAGNTSSSGCEASDFAGFPAGNIALIQRGTCTFELKGENASAAGASAIVFFNQGNTSSPDRTGIPGVTLGNGYEGVPAVGATYALGAALSQAAGLAMHVDVGVERTPLKSTNVIADSRRGNPDQVVMAGAHLDSVAEGPGINDNGSGTAALLEVAEALGKYGNAGRGHGKATVKGHRGKHKAKGGPANAYRFAFWGAEEAGLVGSNAYVADLVADAPAELDRIAMYLNFDMVASPNYGLFIYDGDGSGFGLQGPPGSDHIEATFERFFAAKGVPSEPTEFSGRSDYQAFINNGIPAGGLFTGAEGVKTAEQAAKWGGTAGAWYDACYHAACDTIDNLSHEALAINAKAIASTMFAYLTAKDLFGTQPVTKRKVPQRKWTGLHGVRVR